MGELEKLLKQAFDEVTTSGNVIQVGVGLRRVVNMYLRGNNLSLTLQRPGWVLVITSNMAQAWDGHEKHRLEASLSISGVFIEGNRLYILLELGH